MDFRWFFLGNFIAILSSLAAGEQAEAILYLVKERWEELIGEMPLKICYPAMENQEWQIVTGYDPENSRWSYHNGGSWPVLLWLLVAVSVKLGRPHLARRAMELMERRLAKDEFPKYYNGCSMIDRRMAEKHGCHTYQALHAKRNGNLCRMYNSDQQNSQATSSIFKTALYCAMSWIMMKMGFSDTSATLLCANDWSVMDTLMLFFSGTPDYSPTFLCCMGLPITDMKLVEFIMDIIDEMEVSNRATICLDQSDDGTEFESLKSVLGGIGAIRAWCFKYGLRFDVSRIYGPNLIIYSTPAGGTFYLTIKYLGRSLTLLLAGRSLYIRGWRDGLNGAFEISMGTETPYMLGNVTTISIPENYRFLSPGTSVGQTWMGPDALRYAFETLYKCQGKRSRDLKRAIGILAVHIAEAARIQCVLKAECRSFLSYDQTTLDGAPEHHSGSVLQERKNSFWINEYGESCYKNMEDTEHRLNGTVPPGIENRQGDDVGSSIEVFREVRIVLRDACREAATEEKPPMVEDPSDYYNRKILSSKGLKAGMKWSRSRQERGGQRKKRPLDEFSVGGGDRGSDLIALLLEDWLPEVDKEQEEIKEEEDKEQEEEPKEEEDGEQEVEIKAEAYEEQEQEIEEEADEEQEQEIEEETDEEQADPSHGDFLSHFPGVRKFIEKQLNQVRSVERVPIQPFTTTFTPSSTDVVVSSVRQMQMSTEGESLFSLRAKMRSRSLQRPSRVLSQPSLVRAGHFISRFLRFRFVL